MCRFFGFTAVKKHTSRHSGISRYQEKIGFVRPYRVFRVLFDNPQRGQGGNTGTTKKSRRLRPEPDTPPVPGFRRPGAFKAEFL
jgi:hypothetical protein